MTEPSAPGDESSARPKRTVLRNTLLAVLGLLLVLAALAAAGLYYGLRWLDVEARRTPERPRQTVRLVIPQGASLEEISALLEDGNLVKHARVFMAYAWRNKTVRTFKAGTYRLHNNLSMEELAAALQRGYYERRATFPEGLTVEQIAERLVEADFVDSADALLELKWNPELRAMTKANPPSLEGFLFPDTYFFEPGLNTRQIAERMIETFNHEADDALSSPTLALGRPLSRLELVTLASMIEREARSIGEMPLMASVYYNRLKKKMRMECDATVRYAMNMWDRPVTYEDLKFDSPYNTYRHAGLPPGPICNPSLDAMIAAAHPQDSEFLFYVYRGDGTHEYTKTYKEHLAAVKKYLSKQKAK